MKKQLSMFCALILFLTVVWYLPIGQNTPAHAGGCPQGDIMQTCADASPIYGATSTPTITPVTQVTIHYTDLRDIAQVFGWTLQWELKDTSYIFFATQTDKWQAVVTKTNGVENTVTLSQFDLHSIIQWIVKNNPPSTATPFAPDALLKIHYDDLTEISQQFGWILGWELQPVPNIFFVGQNGAKPYDNWAGTLTNALGRDDTLEVSPTALRFAVEWFVTHNPSDYPVTPQP